MRLQQKTGSIHFNELLAANITLTSYPFMASQQHVCYYILSLLQRVNWATQDFIGLFAS